MADQAKISIKGVIKRIKDIEQVSDKFKKREMWLQETGEHPQTFNLEFHQDTCKVLDGYSEGELVECQINLRGRYWSKNGREGVMNTLQCWKITRQGQGASIQQTRNTSQQEIVPDQGGDDLPF